MVGSYLFLLSSCKSIPIIYRLRLSSYKVLILSLFTLLGSCSLAPNNLLALLPTLI